MKALIIRSTLGVGGFVLGLYFYSQSVDIGSASPDGGNGNHHRYWVSQGRASTHVEPDRRSLKNLMRTWRETEQKKDLRHELERLTADELKSGMLDILATNEADNSQAIRNAVLMKEFGAELYRREGEAALEWALQQDGKWKGIDLGTLYPVLNAAAASSPSILKSWIGRLSDDANFRSSANALWQTALTGAAGRGTDDWIEVAKSLQNFWGSGPAYYAQGFDFSRMLKEMPNGPGVDEALSYWSAQDKDAAWDCFKEHFDANDPNASIQLGSLWAGVAMSEGTEASVDWLISKLDQIPVTMRERTLENIASRDAKNSKDLLVIASAMPLNPDRMTIAVSSMSPWASPKNALTVIRLMPKPQQMESILAGAKKYGKSYQTANQRIADGISSYFEGLADKLNLSDEERAQVMEQLGER